MKALLSEVIMEELVFVEQMCRQTVQKMLNRSICLFNQLGNTTTALFQNRTSGVHFCLTAPYSNTNFSALNI